MLCVTACHYKGAPIHAVKALESIRLVTRPTQRDTRMLHCTAAYQGVSESEMRKLTRSGQAHGESQGSRSSAACVRMPQGGGACRGHASVTIHPLCSCCVIRPIVPHISHMHFSNQMLCGTPCLTRLLLCPPFLYIRPSANTSKTVAAPSSLLPARAPQCTTTQL